jgi:two-component system, NtrC family, response regulator HydG
MTPHVLVVDDDAAVRYTLRNVLEDAGLSVDEAEDGEAALAKLSEQTFHLVLSDLRMPKIDGLELLRRMRGLEHAPRLILITAHGSERAAVNAMKEGAYDYFRKPFEPDELVAVVERAVESVRLQANNERLQAELNLARSMVFGSEAMKRLAVLVARVAPKEVTVLITGESGTGKERLAEAVVRASTRHDKPFVRFNCAALNPDLAAAELFGHKKGAFTGAVQGRTGLFREADGGTLFLDEVGELDARVQALLLRVLQERQVRAVGDDHAQPVDVRIIAATHRDLAERVRTGAFREDLMYRLKVVTLELPPLRERPEDIPSLSQHFLDEFCDRFGSGPFALSDQLRARLCAGRWPGNVRELRNAIESMVALSPSDALDSSLLPGDDAVSPDAAPRATLADRMAAYERGILLAALAASGGNRSEAAKALGIGRATLYEKLERYKIEPK